jgi:outer membrane protein assembly factor BamB
MDDEGLPGDPTSKVSLVDIDMDGTFELSFAGRGGRLHVLDGRGNVVWTWDEPNRQNMHGAPQAYDVDGDGYVEFFLNTNDGFIHRVSHRGELVWTSHQSQKGNQGHPTICDVDRDGLYEVVYASQDYNVYCLDAITGGEKWRFDTEANMETNQVIVADVNGDGDYEVLAWTAAPTSAVICISQIGSEIWRWTLPREGVNIRLCQALADLDRDGSMDMVLMSGDAAYSIDIGGDTPQTRWEVNFSYWSRVGYLPEGAQANHWTSYQTIADFDGDDQLEVLWLVPFPVVTDGASGELEAYYVNEHMARNRRQENGGWWGDFDGDGISDWICEINGNSHPQTMVYSLSMGGKFPAVSYWPEYYHCAYPAWYQAEQNWLLLKGAYSNSLWFPIGELGIPNLALLLVIPCYYFKA